MEVKAKDEHDEEKKDRLVLQENEDRKILEMKYLDLSYKYTHLQNQLEIVNYKLKKKLEDFEEERFQENPLIALVDSIPQESREELKIRIEAMLKML